MHACLSGPNTATDSQTTPPPPAAKEAYSILGMFTPLSSAHKHEWTF